MKFTKMQGTGNDYIYVDCTKKDLKNPSETAVKVSDRHFGIGSDGLILIKSSEKADFFMDMYNADGSRGKMCGNGIRCVGKYVYDNGLTDKKSLKIDTLSGVKKLKLKVGDDGTVESVSVDMGAPVLEPLQIPVDEAAFKDAGANEAAAAEAASDGEGQEGTADISGRQYRAVVSRPLVVNETEYKVTCVSMGNPHAVVYLDNSADIKSFELEKIGPYFEKHPAFPEQVNTEFIQVTDRKNLNMRVWERGSGETLACGTGACAALVATVLNGLCDDEAVLHLLGGDLKVRWDREKNTVFLEGPAVTVCTGKIKI